MKLDVVTPEGAKVKALEVSAITLPGATGEMGILPGHRPLMAALAIGPMIVETAQGMQTFALANGYIEVVVDTLRVLAETCEPADEIDVPRAKEKLEQVTRRLADVAPIQAEAYSALSASQKKAETRIKVGATTGRQRSEV